MFERNNPEPQPQEQMPAAEQDAHMFAFVVQEAGVFVRLDEEDLRSPEPSEAIQENHRDTIAASCLTERDHKIRDRLRGRSRSSFTQIRL